jgi:hypothetical protein
LVQQPSQLAVISDGLSHFRELLLSQRYGDGFGRDLAGPLVTSAAAFTVGPILYGTLADRAQVD